MFEVGQVLYHTGKLPTIPVTKHVIEEKVTVVDGDGKEMTLYKLSVYVVYFPETELISEFSVLAIPE